MDLCNPEYANRAAIKLKDGSTLPEGARFTVNWGTYEKTRDYSRVAVRLFASGEGEVGPIVVSGRTVGRMIAGHVPSTEDLEEWIGDSVCPTPSEDEVEPDGTGESGEPSWLLLLGLI